MVCNKLKKPPYVCNGCIQRQSCKLEKHIYSAKSAQKNYETTRSESRQGIAITPEELKRVDAIVSPLVKLGQSIHMIYKYRRIIYQCNNKFRNKTGCSTPHLTEYEIKEYFIKALNRLITEKDEIIANTEMIQKMLCDNSELEAKRDALQEEIAVTVELTQNAVAENSRVAQDQDDYNKRYNALVERYDRLKAQYDEVSTAISDNEARYEQMGRFITVLKDQEGVITEFDDALWSSLVEKIVVKSKEDVTVVFKDGTEMKAE